MKRVINWFEIPATDLERAIGFYEQVFGTNLRREEINGVRMGVFPHDPQSPSGSVCQMVEQRPGGSGTLIYLDASPDVGEVLSRVDVNGGKVVLDKTLVCDEIGYIGIFVDTEGNRVGVHARA